MLLLMLLLLLSSSSLLLLLLLLQQQQPVPVAAQYKEWVCDRSPVEIVGLNLTGGTDVCLL